MILMGTNLGQRQRDLNTKVIEAANQNADFQQIKLSPETSDVDKLFKIDLAIKYENIDYLIEILKSEDSFHILRALKCDWIYDDKYSNIINVDNLEHNIFPYMSAKMKRKLLTNISNNVTNQNRSECFYTYCMAKNLYHNATKFLLRTPEDFKLNAIQNLKFKQFNDISQNLIFFIGNSFNLAHAFLEQREYSKNDILYELRYLYSISNVEYLDILEKYSDCNDTKRKCLGLRLSKDIMMIHKKRVHSKPLTYIPIINKSILAKHCSSQEAKNYLKALLPKEGKKFWDHDFISKYRSIIDALPIGEKFKFMKKIFTEKYPGQPFEKISDFYSLDYYEIMTDEEKEQWALETLTNKDEASYEYYQYYKFLPFETAFERMKKNILIMPDSLERHEILKSVLSTAKTKEQILKYLEHYYDRHSNERFKDSFIEIVLEEHAVLDFEEDCFNIIYKLMKSGQSSFSEDRCNGFIIIYSILKEKDYTQTGLGVCLKSLIRTSCSLRVLTDYIKKLDPVRKEIVYQELHKISIEVIKNLLNDTSNEYYKSELKVFIQFYLNLIKYFEKSKSDISKIVMEYIKSNWEHFSDHSFFRDELLTRNKLMRFLKNDEKLACNFPLIEKSILESSTWRDEDFRLTTVLRKLKVYFHNDVAQEYIKYFSQCLTEKTELTRLMPSVIHGIFQLADESKKINLLMKYVPENSKIDHSESNKTLLVTQEAICRYAFYSRPYLPLPKILLYVKGDYVRFCLQMFNYFVANLPPSLCLQFVEALINAPVKIQKHGLRFAFQCFDINDLKKIVVKVWTKNKNISLRMVLYTCMFQKIQNQNPKHELELFALFKTMTLDLRKDDHDDVFQVMRKAYYLPEHLRGDYLETAWKGISNIPSSKKVSEHKCVVLERMIENISILKKQFLLSVIEDHIRDVLLEQQNLKEQSVNSAKWDLVTTFIIKVTDEEDNKANVNLVKQVLQKCLEKWNDVSEDIFTMRQLCHDFIKMLVDKNRVQRNSYSMANSIFDSILQDLLNVLPIEEVYLIYWDLKLAIIFNKVADFGQDKIKQGSEQHGQMSALIKDVGHYFAVEIGALVRDLVEKDLFHTSFVENITDKIDSIIQTLPIMLQLYKHSLEMYICIGDSLTNLNMTETYLLAVRILPLECKEGCEEEYRKLLEKIKSHHNSEVRCCMYQKFMNNGFKRRKYY